MAAPLVDCSVLKAAALSLYNDTCGRDVNESGCLPDLGFSGRGWTVQSAIIRKIVTRSCWRKKIQITA
jgi:hypothetical protein